MPQAERLARALRRERLRFTQSYNDRLFGGLVVASLAAIVVFRFVLKVGALETAAWIAFAFLQVRLLSMCSACLLSVRFALVGLVECVCIMWPPALHRYKSKCA